MKEAVKMQTLQPQLSGAFADLRTFCMFIGFPRSGHSLVGALLNAHPNIVIAHELHVLKRIFEGLSELQIYHQLLEKSATKKKSQGTGRYSYVVPDQWQGQFEKLHVIGDKQGGGSTRFLTREPTALSRLRNTISLPTKFVLVVRNPFDNISSITTRSDRTLEESINHYFGLCTKLEAIKKRISANDLFEVKHESFIANPVGELKSLCHFLGEPALDEYLNSCSGVVYKTPHRSRYDLDWNSKLIAATEKRILEFAFLEGYSFQN